jgi:hypothetical protein
MALGACLLGGRWQAAAEEDSVVETVIARDAHSRIIETVRMVSDDYGASLRRAEDMTCKHDWRLDSAGC